MTCPLCGGPSRRRLEAHGHAILDCERCGHRFADVAVDAGHIGRTYDDAYFTAGGAGYAGYLQEGPVLRERGRWYARLLASYTAPGMVLDVGCAAGFWLQGLVDGGWSGVGIESNQTMARNARDQLGLDVHNISLEEFRTDLRFDLIGMTQVIAHFADPRRALGKAAGLLRPSGLLILETWDRDSRMARLLGKHWHEYNPPSVLHWFSKESLRRLAAECSLTEVARGRPRRRIRGDHAKSLLRHQFAGVPVRGLVEPALRIVPDRLSIPYPADDLFWMLFRA